MPIQIRTKQTALLLALFCLPLMGQAQNIISGKITDKETLQSLEGVSVLLFIPDRKTPALYSISDNNGNYSLKPDEQYGDSLRIEVSMLGYIKGIIPVQNTSRVLNVELVQQPIDLKEVVARANTLWMERDTLNYNVNSFKTAQDRVIGDVLKKLPGIDVSQSGAISYNGKPINKFYVEGNDLLDGKYGLATRNIPADAVKKVQVLENHQAIKALEKSEFSDQAAINLVLKDGAKSRWLSKIDAGFGASPLLWDDRLMGMRVGSGLQSINIYKTNNTGNNVTDELVTHTLTSLNFLNENIAEQADWLSVTMPPAPSVSENRYLFNRSHMLSTNNMWRLGNDYQLRTNVSYVNDNLDFATEARTIYYLDADSTLAVAEFQESLRKKHQLNAAITLIANSPAYYLQNNLKLSGSWNKTNATTLNSNNTIEQALNAPNHLISNDFQWIKNKDTHTFQVTSFNSYSLLPQKLQINGIDTTGFSNITDSSLLQRLQFNSFYSNSYATFKVNRGNWRMEMRAGFQAQIQDVNSTLASPAGIISDSVSNDFTYSKFRYLLQPLLGYQESRLRLTLTLPVSHNDINNRRFTLFNPALYVNYDITSYWNIIGNAGFSNTFGDIRTAVPNYILYNYRSIERNTGDLLEQARQRYMLGLTYRNPVRAFFANITANYSESVSNLLYDRSFRGILSQRTAVKQDNNSLAWALTGKISKTVDEWRTTFWLDASYNYITAEQMSQQKWTRYANESFGLRPKVLVKPATWTNTEYEASFVRSQLKVLKPETVQNTPILSISHFLTCNLNLTKEFQVYIHGEYYSNHVSGVSYPDVFFADAGVRYIWKQFEFTTDCRNIFNNRRYEYSLLGTLSEVFSAYNLRPASIVAKVSYAF